MYHSSTLWKKDSLHTQILRSERAGIGAVVVVVVVRSLNEEIWHVEIGLSDCNCHRGKYTTSTEFCMAANYCET